MHQENSTHKCFKGKKAMHAVPYFYLGNQIKEMRFSLYSNLIKLFLISVWCKKFLLGQNLVISFDSDSYLWYNLIILIRLIHKGQVYILTNNKLNKHKTMLIPDKFWINPQFAAQATYKILYVISILSSNWADDEETLINSLNVKCFAPQLQHACFA